MSMYYIQMFYLGYCYTLLHSHEIHLKNFTQDDCSTQCKSGLLLSRDTCQLTSTITFDKVVPDQTTLVYFENVENEFPIIFSLDILTECKGLKENADHYCTKVEENKFKVNFILRAIPSFSKAKIRGYMTLENGRRIISDSQTLPEMFDSKETRVFLIVNGLNMTIDSCHATINANEFNLEFYCLSRAKPCLIEMLVNGLIVANRFEDRAVLPLQFKSEAEINVLIKYSACSLDWNYNVIKCLFQNALNKTADYQTNTDSDTVTIVVPIVIFAVACAVVIIIWFTWRRCIQKGKLPKKEDSNAMKCLIELPAKRQAHLPLDAELSRLQDYYDKEIESFYNEIKQIGDGIEAIKALDEIGNAITRLLNNVNEKDSPKEICSADGERILFEKTRNSLKELTVLIVKKKIKIIQEKLEGINSNEIEIRNILSVIMKDIEILELSKLDVAIRTELATEVDDTTEKLHKLEKLVTLFSNVERGILVLTEKYDLEIPCPVSHFNELHAECDKLFQEFEILLCTNEERAVFTKRLVVMKNAINNKKKENDMLIAVEFKKNNLNIKKKIKGINANEIEIQNILSVIRNDIESLDLTQLDGTIRTEMTTAVANTTKKLQKLEKRVTLFLKLEYDIQVLTDTYNDLEMPCLVSRFKKLHADCDKLIQEVGTSICNDEERTVLTKRLDFMKNAINNKKIENDKTIANYALGFVPIVGTIVSTGLSFLPSDNAFVKHDKQKELEESAHRNLK